MKTTSYIIFATLALILVGAFFLPAMVMTRQEDNNLITFKPTGKVTETYPGDFSELNIEIVTRDTRIETPNVEIVESDSLTAPLVEMDDAWLGNVEINRYGERLTLRLTMARFNKEMPGNEMEVAPEYSQFARVVVPRGTLRRVTGHASSLHLVGFRNATLEIGETWPSISFTDCSFASLVTP